MFKLGKLTGLQLFQLLRYGGFILINIVFAKSGLIQTDIGRFETFIMISGMVSFFWVSGTINTMLATYPGKSESEKKPLLFSTFVTLLIFSVLAGVLLYAFSNNLFMFLHKQESNNLVLLAVFYLLLSGPAFITEYVLFLNERNTALMLYGTASMLANLLAASLPVLVGYGVERAMLGLIIVAALRLAFALYVLNRFATLRAGSATVVSMVVENLKLSAPLIASVFVSGSSEYIDGIIVKAKFDDLSFAIYRYGAKELPVMLIIANTFSTGMIAPIANNLENGMAELKQRSLKLMHLFFPLTIVLLVISPWLYKYAFSESFIYSAMIFNIYLLLVVPRMLFPQTVLTGIRQTRFLLVSAIIEIIINVGLSIYLADKVGLPGIAIGTFVAYSFDKLFMLAVNRFYFGLRVKKYVPLIPYFVYTALTFVAFCCGLQVLRCM